MTPADIPVVATLAEVMGQKAPNGQCRTWPPPWTREQLCTYAALRCGTEKRTPYVALRESNPLLTRWPVIKAKKMAEIIERHPIVAAELARLRGLAARADLMTDLERRAKLAVIARTPVTDFVDKDLTDPKVIAALGGSVRALKKVKKTVRTDEAGETVTHEFETYDPIAAIKLDAELAGELEPAQNAGNQTLINIYQQVVGSADSRGLLPGAVSRTDVQLLRKAEQLEATPDEPSSNPCQLEPPDRSLLP